MNIEEFKKFEGVDYFSPIGEGNVEPHFSWQPCECCQTTFGGSV